MTTAKIVAEHSVHSTRAALASVTLALILLVAKAWAAYRTGSTAMLGSLADTGLDVIASLTTLLGVRIAAMPADTDQRFGGRHRLARDRAIDERRADRSPG
jgi:ferrous-iron efflux pump FieF